MYRSCASLLCAVGALALTACDDDSGLPAAKTGSIKGVCRIAASVPRPRIQPGMTDGDFEVDSPRVVEGEGRALGGCVVTLPKVVGAKEWPEAMRAEGRRAWIEAKPGFYEPHVQWVRVGTQLAFRSALKFDINVHGYKNTFADTQFNISLPPGAAKEDIEAAFLKAPAVYWVTDDSRQGYTAFVHAVANPYADITSAALAGGKPAGEFLLTDVPPGEHEIVCWHEGMETSVRVIDGRFAGYAYSDPLLRTRTVTVEAGRTANVDFEFPAPPLFEPKVKPNPPTK